MARTQVETLARVLSALAADPTPDAFVGQALSVMSENCGAHGGALWLDDAWINQPSLGEADHRLRAVHQVWALEKGALLRRRVGQQADRTMFSATRADIQRMQRGSIIRHNRRTIMEEECYQNHREFLLDAGTRHIAYVPLFFGQDCRGFITLRFGGDDGLAEEDEVFAMALADQVAVALELGRAAHDARETEIGKDRQLAAEERVAELVRVNTALSSAISDLRNPEDLETFIDQTLDAATEIVGASLAALFLVDAEGRRMVVQHVWEHGKRIDFANDPDFAIFRASEPTGTTEGLGRLAVMFLKSKLWWATVDDPIMQETGRKFHKRRGHVSAALVPLWRNGLPLGFIGLGFTQPGRPPQEKLELVRVLAEQLTLAFEFRRLGAESRDTAVAREREQAATLRLSQLETANTALARSIAKLSIQHDLQAYLGSLLQTLLQYLRSGSGSLWLFQPDGSQRLAVWATGDAVKSLTIGESSADEAVCAKGAFLAIVESQCLQPRRSAWMTEDIATTPALDGFGQVRAKLVSSGIRALLAVPVIAGGQHFGSMMVCLETPCKWSAEQVELAQTQANQAALAMEMRRLGEVARQGAITEERNRFARQIHDTLAQDFLAIAAHLQSARRKLAASDLPSAKASPIAAALDIALETAQDGLLEARRSVWALIPRALEKGDGLASALRATVNRIVPGRAGISEAGVRRALPVEVEGELLGIVREAVSNAVRHAGEQASINIHIKYDDDAAHVSVEDDGAGYDLAATKNSRPGHFGLWTMRERAARIGGRLELLSAAGKGTCVAISVPWPT